MIKYEIKYFKRAIYDFNRNLTLGLYDGVLKGIFLTFIISFWGFAIWTILQ